MSFDDFVTSFDFLWVCHLEPDAVSEQISLARVCNSVCTDAAYVVHWLT